jgi:hypothetical protein
MESKWLTCQIFQNKGLRVLPVAVEGATGFCQRRKLACGRAESDFYSGMRVEDEAPKS